MTGTRKVASLAWVATSCLATSTMAAGICDPSPGVVPCVDAPIGIRQVEEPTALPIEAFTAFTGADWIEVVGGSWKITRKQRHEIGFELPRFVESQARAQKIKLRNWSSYTFQIQGQGKGMKKLVLVNAFCISPPPNVRRKFVTTDDEGGCYFHLYFDPERNQLLDLSFNGVGS